VFVGSLDGGPSRFVVSADTSAVVAQDHLLFQRGTALFAQPFDLARFEVRGEPVQIADPVNSAFNGISSVSASRDGKIAFRSGIPGDRRQLTWFDRSGRKLDSLGEIDASRIAGPGLSHYGRRVVAGRTLNRQGGIWVFDLVRGGWTRLTTGGQNTQAVWSPDDRRVAYITSRREGGSSDIYLRPSQPGGDDQELVRSATATLVGTTDWSSDGRYLLFNSSLPGSPQEIWSYSFAEGKPFVVVKQPTVDQSDAKFSPDGRWIAYQSNQSGTVEIYLQPFLGPGDPIRVSNGGGAQARWRGDGREIYYVDFEGRLVAVSVDLWSTGGPKFGTAVPLFPVRLPGGTLQPGGSHQQYDVTGDGERFLVNTLVPDPTPAPITLILNWHPPAITP
jgi:WD40 repeat protein